MIKNVAILGLGHIGKHIQYRLLGDERLAVTAFDLTTGHDLSDPGVLDGIAKQNDAVIAATPFFLNRPIAFACSNHNTAYFDLTESNEVADYIKRLHAKTPMVSQCGLAPGMVSIIASYMTEKFQEVKSIAVRVGALPKSPNNRMGYNLTWNTEGLINEYIHPCKAVVDGKFTLVSPLEDLENVVINGIQLEAANTSGGLGSLAETWAGKCESVTYKTLRYPGHWGHMKFLKDDLGLKENFQTYVDLFNKNVPITDLDRVFILIKVTGIADGRLQENVYSKIIERDDMGTAIQISTASGVLAVVDAWVKGHLDGLTGLVKQEEIPFLPMLRGRYSSCYKGW